MLQALLGMQWPQTQSAQDESTVDHTSNVNLPLRVITHNIRYATSSLFKNEKPWKDRFPLIANELLYHTRFFTGNAAATLPGAGASFICLQEVLHNQLQDILGALNGDASTSKTKQLQDGRHWAHIGVAREDGKAKGEYSPILYPVDLFKLLHFENCWLSPTPHKPSKGWDAGSERILTTGVFEHKATKQRLAVFNTHLDNAGSEARERSIGIILGVVERVRTDWSQDDVNFDGQITGKTPLNYFLAGDFNSFPTQEAYKAVVASDKMVDTYDAVPKVRRYGDDITFTGFQPDTDVDEDEKGRIDFVWFGPKSSVRTALTSTAELPSWCIEGYTVLPNVFDDGIFCSDHRAVVADAVLLV